MKIIPQDTNSKGFDFDVFHRRLNTMTGDMKHKPFRLAAANNKVKYTLTGGFKPAKPMNAPSKPISGGPEKPAISGGPVKPVESPYKYLKTGDFTGVKILDATIGGAVSVGKGLKTVGDTFSLTKAGKRKDLDTKVAFHEKKLAEAEQNYKTKGAELDGLYDAIKVMNAEVSKTTATISSIDAEKKQLEEQLKTTDPAKQGELQKQINELDKIKDEQQKLLEEQNAKIAETNTEYKKVKAEFKKIGDLRDSSRSAFDSTSSKLASLLSQTKTKNQKAEQEGLLGLKQMIQKGQQGGKDNPNAEFAKLLSVDTSNIPNDRAYKTFFLNKLKSAAPELVTRLTKDKNSKFNLYNMDAQQLHSALKSVQIYQDPKMIHEAFLNAVINASAKTIPTLVSPLESYGKAISEFADIGDRMARRAFMTAEAEKSLSSSITEVKKTDTAKAIKQRMLAEKLKELKDKQAGIDAQIGKEKKDIAYYEQLKQRIPDLENEIAKLSSEVTSASGGTSSTAATTSVSEEELTKLTKLIGEEAKVEEAKQKKAGGTTGAVAGAPGVYVNVSASAKVVFPGTGYYMADTKRFVSSSELTKLSGDKQVEIINKGTQITEKDVGKEVEVPEPAKQTSDELIKELITKLPDDEKRAKLLELTDELKAYRAKGVDPESARALSKANIAKLEASKKALVETEEEFSNLQKSLVDMKEAKDTMALIKDKFKADAKTEEINKAQIDERTRITGEIADGTNKLETIDADIKDKSEALAKLDNRLPGYDAKKVKLESELDILNTKREIEDLRISEAKKELANTEQAFARLEEMAIYTAAVDRALDVDMPNRKNRKPEELAAIRKQALAMIGITADKDGKLSPVNPEQTLRANIKGLVKSSGGDTIDFKPSFLLKAERKLKLESRNAKQQRVETVSEFKATMASIGLDYKDEGIPKSYSEYKSKLGRFGKPVPESVFNAAKEKATKLETAIRGFKAENNAAKSKESESKIDEIKKRAAELKIKFPDGLNLSDASAVNAAYYSKQTELAKESDPVKKKQLQDEVDLLDELVKAIPGKSANQARNIKAKGKTDVKANNKTLSNLNTEIGLLNIVDRGITSKSGLKAISLVGKELAQVNKAIAGAKWYKFGAGASTMTDDEVNTIKGLLAKKARLGETLEQLHSRVIGGYEGKGGMERKSKKLRTAAISDLRTKQSRLETLEALYALETDEKVRDSLLAEISEAGEKVSKVSEEYTTYNVTKEKMANIQGQSAESAVVKRLERSLKSNLNKPGLDAAETEKRTKLITDRAKAEDELANIQELKTKTAENIKTLSQDLDTANKATELSKEKAIESILSENLKVNNRTVGKLSNINDANEASAILNNIDSIITEKSKILDDALKTVKSKTSSENDKSEAQNSITRARDDLQQALIDRAIISDTLLDKLSGTNTVGSTLLNSDAIVLNINNKAAEYGINPITSIDDALRFKKDEYNTATLTLGSSAMNIERKTKSRLSAPVLDSYFKSKDELAKKKAELGSTAEPNTQLAKLASDAEYLAAKESQLQKQIAATNTELAKQSKLANAQRLLNQTKALAKGKEFTAGKRGIFGIGKREPLTAVKAKEGETPPTTQGKTRLDRYQAQLDQLTESNKLNAELVTELSSKLSTGLTNPDIPEEVKNVALGSTTGYKSLADIRESMETKRRELLDIRRGLKYTNSAKGFDASVKLLEDSISYDVKLLGTAKSPIPEQIAAETKAAKTDFETTLESAAKISQLDTELAGLEAQKAAIADDNSKTTTEKTAETEKVEAQIKEKTEDRDKARQKVEDYNTKKAKPATGGGGGVGIFSLIGEEAGSGTDIQTQLLNRLDTDETAAKYGVMLKDVKGEMSALDDKLAKAGSDVEREVILARQQKLRTQFDEITKRANKVTEIEGVNRRRDMTSEQADIKRREAKMAVRGYAANMQRKAIRLNTSTTPTKPGNNTRKNAISGRSPLGYLSRKRYSKLLDKPTGPLAKSAVGQAVYLTEQLKEVTNRIGKVGLGGERDVLLERQKALTEEITKADKLTWETARAGGKKATKLTKLTGTVDNLKSAAETDTAVKQAITKSLNSVILKSVPAGLENPIYNSGPARVSETSFESAPGLVNQQQQQIKADEPVRVLENPLYNSTKTQKPEENDIYMDIDNSRAGQSAYLNISPADVEVVPNEPSSGKFVRVNKNDPLLKPGNYTSEKSALESIQSRINGLAELSTKIGKSGEQASMADTGLLQAGKAVLQAELDTYLTNNKKTLENMTDLQKATLAKQIGILGLDTDKIGDLKAAKDITQTETVNELTKALESGGTMAIYGNLKAIPTAITDFTNKIPIEDQRVYLANLKDEERVKLKETIKQEADPAHAKLAKLALSHGDYLDYRIDSVVNRLDETEDKRPSAKAIKSILSNRETWAQLMANEPENKLKEGELESETDTDQPVPYTGKPRLDRILESISQRPPGEFSDREIGKLLEKAEAPAGTLELIKLQRALKLPLSGNQTSDKDISRLALSVRNIVKQESVNKETSDLIDNELVKLIQSKPDIKQQLVDRTANPDVIERLLRVESEKAIYQYTDVNPNIKARALSMVMANIGKFRQNQATSGKNLKARVLAKRKISSAVKNASDYIINNAEQLKTDNQETLKTYASYLPVNEKGFEAMYKILKPVSSTNENPYGKLNNVTNKLNEAQMKINDGITSSLLYIRGKKQLTEKELSELSDFLLKKQVGNTPHILLNEDNVNQIKELAAVKTSRDIKFLKKLLPPAEVINTRLTAIQDDYNKNYATAAPENTSGMGLPKRTMKAIGRGFTRATKKMIRVGDRMVGTSPGQEMVKLLDEVKKTENTELKSVLQNKPVSEFEEPLKALAKEINNKNIGLISALAPEAQAAVIKSKVGDKPLANMSGLGLGGPLNTGVAETYEMYSKVYKDLPTEEQRTTALESLTKDKNYLHNAVITELVKGTISAEQVTELYNLAVQYKEATGSDIFKGKAAELKQQIESLIDANTSDDALTTVTVSENIYDTLPVSYVAKQAVLKLAGLEKKDGIEVPDLKISAQTLSENPKLQAQIVKAASAAENINLSKLTSSLDESARKQLIDNHPSNVTLLSNLGVSDTDIISKVVENTKPNTVGLKEKARNEIFDNLAKHLTTTLNSGNENVALSNFNAANPEESVRNYAALAKAMLKQENGAANLVKLMQNTKFGNLSDDSNTNSPYGESRDYVNALVTGMYSQLQTPGNTQGQFSKSELEKIILEMPDLATGRPPLAGQLAGDLVRTYAGDLPVQTLIDKVTVDKDIVIDGLSESYTDATDANTKANITKSVTEYLKGEGTDDPTEKIAITLEQAGNLAGVLDSEEGFKALITGIENGTDELIDSLDYIERTISDNVSPETIRANLSALNEVLGKNKTLEKGTEYLEIEPNDAAIYETIKPKESAIYERLELSNDKVVQIANSISDISKGEVPVNVLNALGSDSRSRVLDTIIDESVLKSDKISLTSEYRQNLANLSELVKKDPKIKAKIDAELTNEATTTQDKNFEKNKALLLLSDGLTNEQLSDIEKSMKILDDKKASFVDKLVARAEIANIDETAPGYMMTMAGSTVSVKIPINELVLDKTKLSIQNENDISKNAKQILELPLDSLVNIGKVGNTYTVLKPQVLLEGLFDIGKEKLDAIGLTPVEIANAVSSAKTTQLSNQKYVKSLAGYLDKLPEVASSEFKKGLDGNPDALNSLVDAVDNMKSSGKIKKENVLNHIADPERIASARVLNIAGMANKTDIGIGADPAIVNRMYNALEDSNIKPGTVSLTGNVGATNEGKATSAIQQLASGLTQERVGTLAKLNPSDLGKVLLAKLSSGTEQVNAEAIDIVASAAKTVAEQTTIIPDVASSNPAAKYILDTLVDSDEKDVTANIIKEVLPRLQAIKDSKEDKNKQFSELLGERIGYDDRANIIRGLAEVMNLLVADVQQAKNPLYEGQFPPMNRNKLYESAEMQSSVSEYSAPKGPPGPGPEYELPNQASGIQQLNAETTSASNKGIYSVPNEPNALPPGYEAPGGLLTSGNQSRANAKVNNPPGYNKIMSEFADAEAAEEKAKQNAANIGVNISSNPTKLDANKRKALNTLKAASTRVSQLRYVIEGFKNKNQGVVPSKSDDSPPPKPSLPSESEGPNDKIYGNQEAVNRDMEAKAKSAEGVYEDMSGSGNPLTTTPNAKNPYNNVGTIAPVNPNIVAQGNLEAAKAELARLTQEAARSSKTEYASAQTSAELLAAQESVNRAQAALNAVLSNPTTSGNQSPVVGAANVVLSNKTLNTSPVRVSKDELVNSYVNALPDNIKNILQPYINGNLNNFDVNNFNTLSAYLKNNIKNTNLGKLLSNRIKQSIKNAPDNFKNALQARRKKNKSNTEPSNQTTSGDSKPAPELPPRQPTTTGQQSSTSAINRRKPNALYESSESIARSHLENSPVVKIVKSKIPPIIGDEINRLMTNIDERMNIEGLETTLKSLSSASEYMTREKDSFKTNSPQQAYIQENFINKLEAQKAKLESIIEERKKLEQTPSTVNITNTQLKDLLSGYKLNRLLTAEAAKEFNSKLDSVLLNNPNSSSNEINRELDNFINLNTFGDLSKSLSEKLEEYKSKIDEETWKNDNYFKRKAKNNERSAKNAEKQYRKELSEYKQKVKKRQQQESDGVTEGLIEPGTEPVKPNKVYTSKADSEAKLEKYKRAAELLKAKINEVTNTVVADLKSEDPNRNRVARENRGKAEIYNYVKNPNDQKILYNTLFGTPDKPLSNEAINENIEKVSKIINELEIDNLIEGKTKIPLNAVKIMQEKLVDSYGSLSDIIERTPMNITDIQQNLKTDKQKQAVKSIQDKIDIIERPPNKTNQQFEKGIKQLEEAIYDLTSVDYGVKTKLIANLIKKLRDTIPEPIKGPSSQGPEPEASSPTSQGLKPVIQTSTPNQGTGSEVQTSPTSQGPKPVVQTSPTSQGPKPVVQTSPTSQEPEPIVQTSPTSQGPETKASSSPKVKPPPPPPLPRSPKTQLMQPTGPTPNTSPTAEVTTSPVPQPVVPTTNSIAQSQPQGPMSVTASNVANMGNQLATVAENRAEQEAKAKQEAEKAKAEQEALAKAEKAKADQEALAKAEKAKAESEAEKAKQDAEKAKSSLTAQRPAQPISERQKIINSTVAEIINLSKPDIIKDNLNKLLSETRKDTLSQLLLQTYDKDLYNAITKPKDTSDKAPEPPKPDTPESKPTPGNSTSDTKDKPANLTDEQKKTKAEEEAAAKKKAKEEAAKKKKDEAKAEKALKSRLNYTLLNELLPILKANANNPGILAPIISNLKLDIGLSPTKKLNNATLEGIKSKKQENYDKAVKAKAIIDYLESLNPKQQAVGGVLKGGYLSPAMIRGWRRQIRGTKRWLDPYTHIHPKGPASKKEYQVRYRGRGTKRRSTIRPKYQSRTLKLLL